jgi:hypothetical protein
MGKPGRKASNGIVNHADLQNFVAITEVQPNGSGDFNMVGFARPSQQVTVETFDAEGGNASGPVIANPDGTYGWKATVTPLAAQPICFVAQGANGATSTCTYPPVGLYFFSKPLKKKASKKPVKSK